MQIKIIYHCFFIQNYFFNNTANIVLVFINIENQQNNPHPELNDPTLQSQDQQNRGEQQLQPSEQYQQPTQINQSCGTQIQTDSQQQQLTVQQLQPTATPQFEPKQEFRQVIKRTTGVQVRPLNTADPLELETKPFQCKVCNKRYRKNANLRIHMRTHTGEKPFECKYCDKKFYHSSHLREHIRRHTGEKPFQCAVCNKRFTIKGKVCY